MDFVARAGAQLTGTVIKHPLAETLVYVDWRPYVQRQETYVTQSDWVASAGIVLVGAFLSANVEIGGGAPATIGHVENRVHFADGCRDVFRLEVRLTGTYC